MWCSQCSRPLRSDGRLWTCSNSCISPFADTRITANPDLRAHGRKATATLPSLFGVVLPQSIADVLSRADDEKLREIHRKLESLLAGKEPPNVH